MDDPFVSCPYDRTHWVPRSRLQKHIVNCEWKNPKLVACPYNATHRFDKEQMKIHVTECPSSSTVFSDDDKIGVKVKAELIKPKVMLERDYLPQTDPNHEDWDD